jgi:type II secretory pathway pseudopilin PulG
VTATLGRDRSRGFTVLEVTIALGLLAGGFLAVARLLIVASRLSAQSRATTMATWLAASRLEQLRSLAWGCSADGAAIGDVALSPPGALSADTSGFVDYLDGGGVVVGSGLSPPPPGHAVFTRRWSVEAGDNRVPTRTLVVRVAVLRRVPPVSGSAGGASAWVETVRLETVRTRRPG